MGDRLLCRIGPRLQRALQGRDALLCRLGGDEFAVLLRNVAGAHEVEIVAAELARALREPFPVEGMTLAIGGSVGIAMFPAHGEDSHALLRSADVAMYGAKHAGLGVRVYDPDMDQHTPKRLALISDLGRAVRERQLVLHYQPKLDLRSGRITGFEALVRWQHPQLGLLYPGDFMNLAEMSDVIHDLTIEVFGQALQQQQRWRAAGLEYAVSINLSARNLLDRRCMQSLEELVARYRAEPGSVELEITETALMVDPEGAVTVLNRLAEAGVLLSIDDYGTGYSSLAYLRRLPIYALKIDRTFVQDMLYDEQDAVIVRSTVGLAHNLKVLVVAEGVEDVATLAMLGQMECDMAQGFQLSKPLPADAVPAWLEAYHADPLFG
jgi:predicted signal transduction protein with EAL and GGDEF domain